MLIENDNTPNEEEIPMGQRNDVHLDNILIKER